MTPKKKTITVGKKTFNLQHPGIRWAISVTDKCSRNGQLQKEAYIDALFADVVLDDYGIDDFDSLEDLNKAVTEIESFVQTGK